jgi:hypothetical protein
MSRRALYRCSSVFGGALCAKGHRLCSLRLLQRLPVRLLLQHPTPPHAQLRATLAVVAASPDPVSRLLRRVQQALHLRAHAALYPKPYYCRRSTRSTWCARTLQAQYGGGPEVEGEGCALCEECLREAVEAVVAAHVQQVLATLEDG